MYWLERQWHGPRVRWRAERQLRALGLPRRRFSIVQLVKALERQLGSPIYFGAVALPATTASGLVLKVDEAFLVITDSMTPRLHQWHAAMHELMHLVLGHVGTDTVQYQTETLEALFPGLPSGTAQQVLVARTTCQGSWAETEVETLAAITTKRTTWRPIEQRTEVPAQVAAILLALG